MHPEVITYSVYSALLLDLHPFYPLCCVTFVLSWNMLDWCLMYCVGHVTSTVPDSLFCTVEHRETDVDIRRQIILAYLGNFVVVVVCSVCPLMEQRPPESLFIKALCEFRGCAELTRRTRVHYC